MTNHIKRRNILISSGAYIGGLAIASQVVAQSSSTIKLGIIADITGGAAFLGTTERNAAQLAVKEFNARGGIKGKQIELIIEDSQTNQGLAVNAMNKLTIRDKAVAIIGTSTTPGVLAILPIANEEEVPLFSIVSGAAVIEPSEKRRWNFRPAAGGDLSVRVIVDYAKKKKLGKLGILYVANAYGEDGRDEMRKHAPSAGLTLVEESFPVSATSLKPQLAKLVANQVDAIFMHGIGAPSVIVYKDAKELNLQIPVISGHGQANSAFRAAVGDAVIGQPVVGARILVWKDLPESDRYKSKISEFVSKFEREFGAAPDIFSAATYDAMEMIYLALQNSGGSRREIRDWVENNIKRYIGLSGEFNMSRTNHGGLGMESLVMMKATANGGWELMR